MDGEVERRFIGPFDNIESPDFDMLSVEERADEPGGPPKTYLVGYAAVFGQDSVLLGDFIERIEPSAFEIVKSGKDKKGKPLATRGLFNHDPNHLLGRYPVTMQLWVDEKGLKYRILLPESRKDIAESVRRGDLRGSSFSFIVAPGGEKWHYENGQSIRTVTAIKSLVDCGPVTYPAYEASSVAVAQRSLQAFKSQNTVESRRATVRASIMGEVQKCRDLLEARDCGQGADGRFGKGNTCQAGGDSGKSKKDFDNQSKKVQEYGKYVSGTSKSDTGMQMPSGKGGALSSGFALGVLGSAAGAVAGLPGMAVGGLIGAVAGAVGGRIASEKAAKAYESLKKATGTTDKQITAASQAMSTNNSTNGTVFVTDDYGSIGISGFGNSEIAYIKSTTGQGTSMEYHALEPNKESIDRATKAAKAVKADVLHMHAAGDADAKALKSAGFEKNRRDPDMFSKTLSKTSKRYDELVEFLAERRAFCSTGKGGGVDPSCGKGDAKPEPSKGDTAIGGKKPSAPSEKPKSLEQQRLEAAGLWDDKIDVPATAPYDGGDNGGFVLDRIREVRIPGSNQVHQINTDDPSHIAQYVELLAKSSGSTVEQYMKDKKFGGTLKKPTPHDKVKLFGGQLSLYGHKASRPGWGNAEDDDLARRIGSTLRAAGMNGQTLSHAVREYAKANGTDPQDEMYSGLRTYANSPREFVEWALKRQGFHNKMQSQKGNSATKKKDGSQSRHDELVEFLAERRAADCGREAGGKFGSGNTCASAAGGVGGEPPPQSGDSKYMEWKKGDHEKAGKTEKAQKFIDKARKDQTISAGKDGGKSDDGGGVQTWSKGDSFPWTVKQVGDVDGHMQGIHPDGSKTEKYKFYGGDTKEASKKVAEEIAKRKKAK